jgi:hypothetical protein
MPGGSMSRGLARAATRGSGGERREPLLTTARLCCVIALTVAGCATPPEVKRDTLDATAWRGSALTGVGRQMVVDAVAGSAPQTLTLIDVNQRVEVAGDPERRVRTLNRRVEHVEAELRHNGVAPVAIGEWPGAGQGGVQTYPPAELQTRPMAVIAHY